MKTMPWATAAIMAWSGGCQQRPHAHAGPELQFAPSFHHFGPLQGPGEKIVQVQLNNGSAKTLTLQRLATSCGCVVPNVGLRPFGSGHAVNLPPGVSQPIELRLDLNGAGEKSARICASTEEGISAEATVTFTAVPAMQFRPDVVRTGPALPGSSHRETVDVLVGRTAKRYRLAGLNIGGKDWLRAELLPDPVERTTGGDFHCVARIGVSLTVPKAEGPSRFEGYVRLRFLEPDAPDLQLPVIVEVRPQRYFEPAEQIVATKSDAPAEVSATLRCAAAAELKLKSVPTWLTSHRLQHDGGVWTFHGALRGGDQAAHARRTLEFEADGEPLTCSFLMFPEAKK